MGRKAQVSLYLKMHQETTVVVGSLVEHISQPHTNNASSSSLLQATRNQALHKHQARLAVQGTIPKSHLSNTSQTPSHPLGRARLQPEPLPGKKPQAIVGHYFFIL